MSSHTACLTILLKHRYYIRTDTEKRGSNHLIENSSEQTQMLLKRMRNIDMQVNATCTERSLYIRAVCDT